MSICENNQTKQFVCSNQEFLNFCKENNLEMFGFELPEIAEQKLSQVALEAKDYVEFASKQIEAQNFVLPSKLEPIYMALSQAEEELLKREKNAQHSQG